MGGKKGFGRIARFFKAVYLKLFRINDTPQKIAIGFGLGVFSGVMPGTGPIAALFLALIFRVNRASALLGSILVNTWLSIPLFFLSVKTGSLITGLNYRDICNGWAAFLKEFHWIKLLQLSMYEVILPIISGYLIVSICIGVLAYAVTLAIVSHKLNK